MQLVNSIVVLVTLNALVSPSAIAMKPVSQFINSDVAPAIAAVPSNGNYSLNMRLPEDGNATFRMLSFSQQNQDQSVDPIQFDLSQTKAFMGSAANAAQVQIKETWMDETGTIWIEFDSALPPKTPLTVVFKVKQFPSAKAYQYGIAAYPATERAGAIFVGNSVLTKVGGSNAQSFRSQM